MLTAKIGDNIINCYDEKYSKEELKSWSNKNIIKCPACRKTYEYCHGQINTPYFRHKDKTKCDYLYAEPETEEHIKGKIALYNWIKSQNGVTNAVLEAWIPETKQRPDIMFEYGGQKWIIEFQCSPIASEQIERHNLYNAGGIKDIWICGKKNYGTGKKHMEKIMTGMFDYENNIFNQINDLLNRDLLPYKHINYHTFTSVSIDDLTFNNKIIFTDNAMKAYIDEDIDNYERHMLFHEKIEYINKLSNVCSTIPEWYKQVCHNCKITIKQGSNDINSKYLLMMNFDSDITFPFTIFIKDNIIDVCCIEEYSYKKYKNTKKVGSFIWKKSTRFIKIDSIKYTGIEDIVPIIKNYFSTELRKGIIRKYNKRGGKIND